MCVFCQIIAGDIPSYKVYEDEKTLAFLDINPVSVGHTLVVAKGHYSNLEEIPFNELTALISSVQKVGRLLKDKLGIDGYNVTENNDPVAGQEISHIHFHVIPRFSGDSLDPWPRRGYELEEAERILKKIIG